MRPLGGTAITAAIALAALSLGACGGDDSSEDEDQIRSAIETSATSPDPSVCTRLQTQRFNEQTEGEEGEAALRSCREDAEQTPAESVEVSEIEIDDESATTRTELSGGFLGGQTLEIGLVKEGDRWKLDELTRFIDFDRDALLDGFRADVRTDPAIADRADCLVAQLDRLDDAELQELVLHPDPEDEDRLFGACFR